MNNVSRVERCESCGEHHEYVVRSRNVNSVLTDAHIQQKISSSREKPYEYHHCETCDFLTLRTIIGFKGVDL